MKFIPPVSVSWRLRKRYITALRILQMNGYSDTGSPTTVAALRKSIEAGWLERFGEDVRFPDDQTEVPEESIQT